MGGMSGDENNVVIHVSGVHIGELPVGDTPAVTAVHFSKSQNTVLSDGDDEPPRLDALGVCLCLCAVFTGSGLGLLFICILLAILFALPITSIAIGVVHLHDDCTIETRIPALLIAGGVLSIINVFVRALVFGKSKKAPSHSWGFIATTLHVLVTLIDCIWMIVTSVMVYRVWTTVKLELEERNSKMYCNKELYLFTFGYLTFCWVVSAILLLAGCCKIIFKGCQCFIGNNDDV